MYGATVDFIWRLNWNEQWGTILAVRPGVQSDFTTSRNAFRVSALALVSWKIIPDRLTAVFGVAYADRNDFQILPAVGVTWLPDARRRFEIVFPRPKIAYRVGHIPYCSEDWVYVRGNIGGNTWAVTRTSGAKDELTLFDYRVSLGVERVVDGGGGVFAEIGWVFGRRLEYESNNLELNFNDSFVIEAGFTY